MDLNHDSATERYTETLNSALTYFSSLAQSTSGWKRLSSTTVRSTRNGTSGSPATGGKGAGAGSSSASSSPNTHRHGSYEDLMASLLGGATPSSAASAAIESLLPAISVSRKSVPGKSAEIVRASILLPGLNEQTDLEDWRAVLECTGARKIWDQMVESSTVLMTLDDSTCITKTIFKTTWPASPRDALLIETTLLDHNAVLHIATSIKPSHDDPIFMRPSPPHVRAYLPLVAWHIQLVPADLDDTVSFTSFNSLAATQNRPVMPRHSIRVSFYYQIDMRGWAVNSSVSMQSHVPSCIANVYRLLRRQGVPPHVSRHSPRIQLDLNEYDPATGIYELRYDVIPLDSEDLLMERRTVSSALKQFRLGSAVQEEGPESSKDALDSSSIPQEIVLSDDDETEEADADNPNDDLQHGYVDVELDGEKWGVGSDIVVHIFMNDIEDEEFVQEHVECLKYMGRDRYILRMKHTEIGSNHGAINVKLRIERIPQQTTGGANLLSHQQLRSQRQQQEQELQQQQMQQEKGHENLSNPDMTGLIVSVNGHEKNIMPFHRSSIQGAKRVSMSLQEQLELSQQIVQEVDDSSGHWRSGSEGLDSQEQRSTASPLLLMSSSMPTTMQSLNRSNQSILSNGTSTMAPGNTNPSKVNSSYTYFNSLLQEPAGSWKAISKQRGVQISKLETQGHASGIVKGEGIFEDYSIWDLKAVLDCASARKIWDKMFDESHMLQQATPSSILSYVRLKGFWPTSPKDMAVLNTTFITKDAIHYFATSVDDTTQYPSIPPPVSPFVRSELVVSGWYLEAVKPRSVRVVYIAQAPPTGWVVPGSALGAMTTEMPLCVAEIIKYLETYGSPPTLVSIRRGRALGVDYSHEKSTFRLEYVQDSNPIFSGHRVLLQQQQQQQVQAGDRYRRSTVDYTAGVVGSGEHQSLHSPKLGPTDKLLAEIRLDARTWARNGDSEITIDPPPSKVTCSCVPHDGTGYRLRIEHSSGRAVPAGGKVLLMARKPAKPGCGIVVNGVAIKMPSMEHLDSWMPRKASETEKDKALTMSMVDGALTEKESQDENEDDSLRTKLNDGNKGSTAGEDDAAQAHVPPTGSPDRKRSPEGLQTPLQYAQGAMNLLSRIRSEPEDSWSVVSDSKGGMRVTKRFMPTEISDQVPLVRGEKVMEGFSLEEIATVIGTLGTRSKLDDLFESGEMLESFGAGCSVFHHVLKSYFPLLLPSRDLYFITATASVEASARCPQVILLSTSVPLEAITHNPSSSLVLPSATSAPSSSPAQARPRAHLHLSAWILERIDPYSTSHPIPSTRVTYMTALDLGGSVPQWVSGMVQTMLPKMITQVETYLQAHAAPPIVRIPEQMVIGPSSETDTEFMDEGHEKPLPSILPWVAPANRLISSEFKLKDSFCEVVLLFDQFRLSPSRLDLTAKRRARKHKKTRQKSREDKDHARDNAEAEESESDSTGSQEKTLNRTVLEMVVDLKQYPTGYNIMTNIKVDPEFLLQQKQQRDSVMKQSMMVNSTSSIKRSGSALLQAGSTANTSTSTSKFIGGFESNVSGSVMDGGGRPSLDGEAGGHTLGGSKSSSSEAASSGTGIAAVLGGAANLSRPLPSSTSLIRILPPPLTVHVIDIPPAPSHSSSLSGISKRRKHLIIVTVPEAESSQAYAQAQQQQAAAASQQSLKSGAPLVVSGTTAKPVMTASTASGSSSMNFAADDRSESSRSRPEGSSSSSSQDTDCATSEVGRPGFLPSTLVSSDTLGSTKPTLLASVTKPAMAMETRMFQFGVKIDRLEHAAAQATKETLGSLAEEMEWLGRVLVDGVPVKVMSGLSRQELGFTDGMMEDDEDGAELQRGQSPKQNGNVYSDKETEANGLNTDHGDDDGGHGLYSDDGAPTLRSTSGSRKRRHHRQQLAQLDKRQDSGSGAEEEGREGRVSRKNGPGSALGTPSMAESVSNQRPTSSMSGFSAFLMNVGLLSQRGSRADLDAVAENARDGDDGQVSMGSSSFGQSQQSRSSMEYEDLDDDRTIRASKSVIRNRISDAMNTRSSSGRKKTRNGGQKHMKADPEYEHDLDLESLHGSIVFQNHHDGIDNDLNDAPSGTDVLRSEIDVEYDERRSDRAVLDWARESGTVRRRKGKEATRQQQQDDEGFAASDDRRAQGERNPMDSGAMLPSGQAQKQHRRQGSRSSLLTRHRSRASSSQSKARRPGSTNGADHPRFRGSLLYAYTFRNLFWCAVACFLLGLLLRIYVIGPSFLKTVSRASGGGPNGPGYTTTYYYYRAAPRRPAAAASTGTFTSPASKTLSPLTGKGSRGTTSRERDGDSQDQHQERGEDRTSSAEAELEGSVWPQGIREVFTVRRILGWDFVLLAYPAQEQQQQQQQRQQ